jgi:hypothetical protein
MGLPKRRIPPSAVSVRRIVSDILNMGLGLRQIGLGRLDYSGLSHPPRGNSRDFRCCSHRGSVKPQTLVKAGHTMSRSSEPETSCVRAPNLVERIKGRYLLGNRGIRLLGYLNS